MEYLNSILVKAAKTRFRFFTHRRNVARLSKCTYGLAIRKITQKEELMVGKKVGMGKKVTRSKNESINLALCKEMRKSK